MTTLRVILPPLTAAAILFSATSAFADAIDGDWCAPSDGRHIHISGPKITTPAGQTTTGDYTRHTFSYIVPEGEPGAGGTVDMRLLNEHEVSIREDGDPPVIWRRCDVNV